MASFSLDKTKLSLLASVITTGLEMAPALAGASDENEQAIAALLEELDAIAGREGSAEITVMGDNEWLEPR